MALELKRGGALQIGKCREEETAKSTRPMPYTPGKCVQLCKRQMRLFSRCKPQLCLCRSHALAPVPTNVRNRFKKEKSHTQELNPEPCGLVKLQSTSSTRAAGSPAATLCRKLCWGKAEQITCTTSLRSTVSRLHTHIQHWPLWNCK